MLGDSEVRSALGVAALVGPALVREAALLLLFVGVTVLLGTEAVGRGVTGAALLELDNLDGLQVQLEARRSGAWDEVRRGDEGDLVYYEMLNWIFGALVMRHFSYS